MSSNRLPPPGGQRVLRRKLFRVRRVLRDSGGRRLRLVLRDGRLARGEQEAADQENERGDEEFFHRTMGEPPSLFRPNENRKPLNPRPPRRGMCSCRCRTLASAISLQRPGDKRCSGA